MSDPDSDDSQSTPKEIKILGGLFLDLLIGVVMLVLLHIFGVF